MEEDWLGNPIIVDPSLEENQTDLDELVQFLDPRIIKVLRDSSYTSLFPVQKAVIETLARNDHSHDLLVSASTGSGKTLAYILPIVNQLSNRVVRRLRALIVVPGRELAHQVSTILEPFTAALDLSMAVVVGQTSMIAEQKKLVSGLDEDLLGGSSNIDILVATPGRLVDHLQFTKNFSLQHLQWLVIDEADRLLDQNFQEWLPKVLSSTEGPGMDPLNDNQISPLHDAISIRENVASIGSLVGLNFWATPLRKMLFSATLTKNPAKLAQLHLNHPVYLSVSADSTKYSVPDELEEYMVISEDGEKALALLTILGQFDLNRTICFTKSREATEKLTLLLQKCSPDKFAKIAAFSGDLIAAKRQEILNHFNDGLLDLLICSDGAARGLDLQQVGAVINYDIPIHAKTYIHRVGRTARAGQKGRAFSLLESREAHHFKQMLSQGRSGKAPVKKLKLKIDQLDKDRARFEQALAELQLSNGELVECIMHHRKPLKLE